MTKPGQIKFIIAASAVLGALLLPSDSHANTYANSPFGNDAVDVYIGLRQGWGGETWVIFHNRQGGSANYGNCGGGRIGTAAGLSDNYTIQSFGGADRIYLDRGPYSFYCNNIQSWQTFTAGIAYGGLWIDVHGNGNNDVIYTGANDPSYAYGDDGADRIEGYGSAARAYGGNGDDTLITYSSTGASERLYGEDGTDCLQDANGSFITLSCGAATNDKYVNSGTTACEVAVASCM